MKLTEFLRISERNIASWKKFLKMKGVNEMTHSKAYKETLKGYKHHLVTKEDLPFTFAGLRDDIKERFELIKKFDIPYCTDCQKFGGDLIGTCIAYDTKQEAEKLRKAREEENKIHVVKMGFMVDTDEAQHWIDADRFDLMGEWHRLFKGVKLVAMFDKRTVNYIKSAEQPSIIIRGNTIHGNHI